MQLLPSKLKPQLVLMVFMNCIFCALVLNRFGMNDAANLPLHTM